LAGFIESDGGFLIRFSQKKIACSFSLEQRIFYPKTNESFEPILLTISLFLNGKLQIIKRENGNSYFIIRVENQNSASELIRYLDRYPLKSSKYLDYLD
jgi:LAGLIDADG endonuclease